MFWTTHSIFTRLWAVWMALAIAKLNRIFQGHLNASISCFIVFLVKNVSTIDTDSWAELTLPYRQLTIMIGWILIWKHWQVLMESFGLKEFPLSCLDLQFRLLNRRIPRRSFDISVTLILFLWPLTSIFRWGDRPRYQRKLDLGAEG